MIRTIIFSCFYTFVCVAAKTTKTKTGKDHPTLPTLWSAETIDPPMGQGLEQYKFVSTPTPEEPSAIWSKYEGCQRLIYNEHSYGTRYLLGCDAVECCTEDQEGNQVEFQIPNVHYSDPRKEVEVSYQRANITNFGEVIECDEWSWTFAPGGTPLEKFKAYTQDCDDCVNGVTLLQWSVNALGQPVEIQFKGFKGFDPESEEGKDFSSIFAVPDICADANPCAEGVHTKYFGSKNPLAFY